MQKAKIPFYETLAKIQADFKQMVGNTPRTMPWNEEEKKRFYDELSGDE